MHHSLGGNFAIGLEYVQPFWLQATFHSARQEDDDSRQSRSGIWIKLPNVRDMRPRHHQCMTKRGRLGWKEGYYVFIAVHFAGIPSIAGNDLTEWALRFACRHLLPRF